MTATAADETSPSCAYLGSTDQFLICWVDRTLNQVRGREPGSGPLPRAFFCPELASGERLMGCRGGDENFDGTIAIASGAGGNRPELRSAWVADTDEWKFVPGKRDDWICNRGLTAN